MSSEITLNNSLIGSVILDVEETDSTNEEAHSLAGQGFQEGTVITAKRQTKGRGRRGNHWYSPEGGLYCSCILRPNIAPKQAWIFERLAGVVVWQTVASLVPRKPKLKPPNDILIRGKKVAGILIESRGGEKRLDYIVIGVGINCSMAPDSFPPALRNKITTLSLEAGYHVQVSDTLNVLINYLNHWYKYFLAGEHTQICDLWEAFF